MVHSIFAERLLDLGGELAGRLQNEGARHPGPGASALQHGQHRQGKGGCLAGARLGDPQDVAAFKGVGNGLFLNRRRRVVARRFDGFEHFLAQAEFAKFHLFSLARTPRVRCFVIWGPRWTASMCRRILARKPRAAPEPSFALGETPHRTNQQKVKSTRAIRVCQVVAVRRDVAVCASPCVRRNAGRRMRESFDGWRQTIRPPRGRDSRQRSTLCLEGARRSGGALGRHRARQRDPAIDMACGARRTHRPVPAICGGRGITNEIIELGARQERAARVLWSVLVH